MKIKGLSVLLAVALFGYASASETVLPNAVGFFDVKNPAFLTIENNYGNPSLMVTTFGLSGDSIREFGNFGYMPPSSTKTDLVKAGFVNELNSITKDVLWPNMARKVPSEYGFGDNKIIVATGFFPIPWKATGEVAIYDLLSGKKELVISKPKKSWFFHQALFEDMNGNGNVDVIAARARKAMFGGFSGEIVWYENPGKKGVAWKEHVINVKGLNPNGVDVAFKLHDLNGDGQKEIIATEFGNEQLSVLWKQADGSYKKQIIDSKLGKGFDLSFVDLNNDGKLNLLATNHESKKELSAVYAYEIPDNLNDAWIRHTIQSNIETTIPGMGQASPGKALAFKPNSYHTGKPYVVVSGDGSKEAYVLMPKSEDANNWEYNVHTLVTTSGIVGQPAVGDVDGDGGVEIFIPAYDDNKIYVFSYE